MYYSQNSYSVIDRYEDCTYYGIAGTGGRLRLPLRKGPAGYVLKRLTEEFNEYVETLNSTDCHGYNRRRISGSDDWSNHASATAVDLNATRHGYGRSDTFTYAQLIEIRRILDDFDDIIKWGGDYRYTKDEMHFEIDRPIPEVKLVASRLRRNNRVYINRLKPGRRNLDAYMVKRELRRRGFFYGEMNNYYGRGLRNAYSKWQEHLGYTGSDADGLPGPWSLEALGFTVI